MEKDMKSENMQLRKISEKNNLSKTVDNDDIDNKIKKIIQSYNKIRIYHPITVVEIWVFTIVLGVMAISGVFLIRDWLYSNFGVYGRVFIPTPKITLDIHIWFGFLLIFLGFFHLVFHLLSKNKKDILPKRTSNDFKSFLHSGMFLIGLARRETYEKSIKFNGRQRIVYTALIYIVGLTIITGFIYYINFISDDLALIHIIPAGFTIMVLLFHVLITIRNHDSIALKAAFLTGKLPIWYVRKNNTILYKKLRLKQKNKIQKHLSKIFSDKELSKQKSDLLDAVSKFFYLIDENPAENKIKIMAENLKSTLKTKELNRIIELADQLD